MPYRKWGRPRSAAEQRKVDQARHQAKRAYNRSYSEGYADVRRRRRQAARWWGCLAVGLVLAAIGAGAYAFVLLPLR